ncbi:MAG: hypothetical protein HZB39_06405 [Planctomycetes bacterium]|nr:hypothetical protein [Planctomycetota bacterium]
MSNEPTDSLGSLLFGLRRDAPQPVLGCALYVDPLAWMPLAVPLAAGDLPIANDPSLAGALVAMQAAYLATDPEFRLAASNAVYLTLGS